MRLKRRSARDELRALYADCVDAFERGYLAERIGRARPIDAKPHLRPAYRLGRDAARKNLSAALTGEAWLACFTEWCRHGE